MEVPTVSAAGPKAGGAVWGTAAKTRLDVGSNFSNSLTYRELFAFGQGEISRQGSPSVICGVSGDERVYFAFFTSTP